MARYDGNGSWDNLLVKNYGKNITGSFAGETAYNKISGGIYPFPLSVPFAGLYDYNNGSRASRETGSNYWETSIGNSVSAYRLNFNSTSFYPKTVFNKGRGYSVRCVAKLKNSSAFYGSLL